MEQKDKYRILPDLSNEQFEALKKSIADRGVLIPIETDELGNVLDGFHRKRACEDLGIEAVPFTVRAGFSEEGKIEHILRMNFARRHLSKSEKKKIALQLRTKGWSQERIAIDLGVSQKTISNWLDPEFSKITELTAVIGKDGKQYPPRQVREEPQGQEQKESGDIEDERIELLLKDLRGRGHQIQKHSVDLILTHSPGDYPDLWQELVSLAGRILKPGRLLVLSTGQRRLPEMIRAFSKRLEYVWTGSLILLDESPELPDLHIYNNSKLVLFFSSGPYQAGPWFIDDFSDSSKDWQELGIEPVLIEQLTSPGDIIFDPFGCDKVAVAAQQLKRQLIEKGAVVPTPEEDKNPKSDFQAPEGTIFSPQPVEPVNLTTWQVASRKKL